MTTGYFDSLRCGERNEIFLDTINTHENIDTKISIIIHNFMINRMSSQGCEFKSMMPAMPLILLTYSYGELILLAMFI